MAGRRPIPTAIKQVNGNPGRRPLNDSEPKPEGKATCPRHLDKEARKEWRRMAKELERMGLLTSVDRAALAIYCQAWSTWVDAAENIQKFGKVIKTPKGYPIQNPYLSIANTAVEQMGKFGIEFGMTPSSRSRIKSPQKGDKKPAANSSPLRAFLNRKEKTAEEAIQ